MGYYTDYYLSYEIRESVDDALTDFKEEVDRAGIEIPEGLELSTASFEDRLEAVLESETFCDYSPLSHFLGGYADSCKWYDHEIDMKTLSNKFPGVLFILEGKGEESGDIWKKYFLAGKMQRCPGKITFDGFDENKLK